MKLFAAFLSTLLIPTVVFAQMGPNDYRIGETRRFAWDYSDSRTPPAEIVRFEIILDGIVSNPNVTITPPSPIVVTYISPVPILPVGNHIAVVRACTVTECGLPSVELQWRIWGLLPNIPGNPRLIPNDQPISGAQAIDMAQSYSFLMRLVGLKQPEATYLINNYDGRIFPDGTLPYGDVMDYLDRQAHLLLLVR